MTRYDVIGDAVMKTHEHGDYVLWDDAEELRLKLEALVTTEELYIWLKKMHDLRRTILEHRRDFMARYPTNMPSNIGMENAFAEMMQAVSKFENGIFNGTYDDRRDRASLKI